MTISLLDFVPLIYFHSYRQTLSQLFIRTVLCKPSYSMCVWLKVVNFWLLQNSISDCASEYFRKLTFQQVVKKVFAEGGLIRNLQYILKHTGYAEMPVTWQFSEASGLQGNSFEKTYIWVRSRRVLVPHFKSL